MAILLALTMTLTAVVALFLYLTHPTPTALQRPAAAAPNFRWSSYGREEDLLRRPDSIAVGPNGRIYITDTGNSRVVVLTSNGGFIESFDTARTDGTKFREPTSLDVSSDGRIYVVDVTLGGLFILSPSGEPVRTILPDRERPIGVEVGPNAAGQESLYVTTRSGIIQATLEGSMTSSYFRWGGEEAMFDTPISLALGYTDTADSAGGQGGVVAYVADSLNYRIQAIESLETSPTVRWVYGSPLPDGTALRYQGADRKFGLPVDITLGADGTLYVLDGLSSAVVMLDAKTGEYRGEFGEAGQGDGLLNMPGGIEYSDGNILVADKYADRISVFAEPNAPFTPAPAVVPFQWLPWLIALAALALAQVGVFVYLLAVRTPRFIFDAPAIERLSAEQLGEAVAAAFGTLLVPGDTDVIARESLPECVTRSVTFDLAALEELEEDYPLADPYGLAALATVLSSRRKAVLVTGDVETAKVAAELSLDVVGVDAVAARLSDAQQAGISPE